MCIYTRARALVFYPFFNSTSGARSNPSRDPKYFFLQIKINLDLYNIYFHVVNRLGNDIRCNVSRYMQEMNFFHRKLSLILVTRFTACSVAILFVT